VRLDGADEQPFVTGMYGQHTHLMSYDCCNGFAAVARLQHSSSSSCIFNKGSLHTMQPLQRLQRVKIYT
jgi:hypothetical protein